MSMRTALNLAVAIGIGVGVYSGATAAFAQGACCIELECQPVEDEDTCNMLGGVFLPGADCADDPCGEGACCAGSACVMTDAYSCITAGREFMGAGTDCADDPCELGVGACCIDGECSILPPEECASSGGMWLGYGTICDGDPCQAGACCLPGECLDIVRYECDALGGVFEPGLDCSANPCEVPNDCPTNSLYSQSRDGPDFFLAYTSEEAAGYTRLDDFSGVCGPIDGVTWWGLDLEFVGGGFVECVETDNTFDVAFLTDADGVPGSVVCSYTLPATRMPTGIEYLGAELNEYRVTLPEPCVLVNGWISIVGEGDPSCWFLWMSAGFGLSYCEGCSSPLQERDLSFCLVGSAGGVFGACCDDATGDCGEHVEIIDCLGPDQRFAPDGACSDFDPPCGVRTGACCFADETCVPLLTEEECEFLEGNWLGGSTNCAAEPCVIGSCCVPGIDCMEISRFECVAQGGVFTPGGDCIPDPCAELDCPPDSLFGQPPDDPLGFTSYTSELSAGYGRFENFAGVAGPIESLMWWGLDLQWVPPDWYECEESDNTFQISFHEDAGGVPGPAVCSYTLEVTRTQTGILYMGAEMNEYSVTLPQPCVLVNGWVSIVGLGDPDCWFLWMSSGDGAGQSYCEGCVDPWHADDLSVCLVGPVGGVYGACCDDTTGTCNENVEIVDCLGADQRFAPDGVCEDFDPPCGELTGACCWDDGTCTIELAADCLSVGGNWLGPFTLCSQCPCITPCPPDGVAEGEPVCHDDYVDTFNGGCDAEAVVFSPLSFCEPVCGQSGVFLSGGSFVGDFDWYEIDVATTTELTWEVEGEFPIGAWIVDGRWGCEGATVMAADQRDECEPFSLSVLAEPGTYWLVVGPTEASDLAQCGARYTATAARSAPCPGDLDDDGDVDLTDLGRLLSNYGTASGAEYEDGDLDCDRDVDLADLAALLANYGGCGEARTGEPGGGGFGGAKSGTPGSDDRRPHPSFGAEGISFDADRGARPSMPGQFGVSKEPVVR